MRIPRPLLYISAFGTVGGCFILTKDGAKGRQFRGDEKIFGRTVIVTGANSGLGFETAKELANRGGRIIMGCRDMNKCEEARKEIMEITFNKNVHCKTLDLASLKSVREFAKDIIENENRLDILINNAGVMCPAERELTEDGFEMQLGVNHLGPFLLTNLLIPKLKDSAPSRIINVTSIAHKRARMNFKDLNASEVYAKDERYYISKLANVMFTRELADMLKGTGITTYVVHPGMCMTNIGRHLPMDNSLLASLFIRPVMKILYKSPKDGIQTTLYCALEPSISNESGEYYEECEVSMPSLAALNEESSRRLWLISERWTRLKES